MIFLTLYTRDMTATRQQQFLIPMLILSGLNEIFCAHKGISLTNWTTIIGFLVRTDMEDSGKQAPTSWLNLSAYNLEYKLNLCSRLWNISILVENVFKLKGHVYLSVLTILHCSINTQTFFISSIFNQLDNMSIVMYNVLYYNNLKNSLD